MALESQTERIERLGNEGSIWYGQAAFHHIILTPCWESVVVPGSHAVSTPCAACGRPLAAEQKLWGSIRLAERIAVVHTSLSTYEVCHIACVDPNVPSAHEIGHRREYADAPTGQMALFDTRPEPDDDDGLNLDYDDLDGDDEEKPWHSGD